MQDTSLFFRILGFSAVEVPCSAELSINKFVTSGSDICFV